jgi:hypothetical protein
MQIGWKDSSIVHFLSTVQTGAEGGRISKNRKFPPKKRHEVRVTAPPTGLWW